MARTPRIDTGDMASSESMLVGDLESGFNEEILTGDAMRVAGDLDYHGQLAFMEETLTVRLHQTSDKYAEPMPGVWVNGRSQYFPRGVPVKARRKYIEGLVRAKPDAVSTDVTVQSLGAEPTNRVVRSSALKYPFEVLDDPNPRGRAWLSALLTEGNAR